MWDVDITNLVEKPYTTTARQQDNIGNPICPGYPLFGPLKVTQLLRGLRLDVTIYQTCQGEVERLRP